MIDLRCSYIKNATKNLLDHII